MDNEAVMMAIAVLGGTGKEGKGLAYRWAKAGYQVLIGSRTPEKAVTAAAEIIELMDGLGSVVGMNSLQNGGAAGLILGWIEAINSVVFQRPIAAFGGRRIKNPGACVREPLRFGEVGFATLQGQLLVGQSCPCFP